MKNVPYISEECMGTPGGSIGRLMTFRIGLTNESHPMMTKPPRLACLPTQKNLNRKHNCEF